MKVQTTLRKRKTDNFVLQTGSGADAHGMSEEGAKDDSEPAPSLTLGKKESATMRKLVKSIVICPLFMMWTSKLLWKNTSFQVERI